MSSSMTRDSLPGVLKMLAAMLLMGTVGYFVVESKQQSHNVVFFRCLFGVVFLGIYCFLAGYFKNTGLTKRSCLIIILSGLFLILNWIMLFQAFKNTSISIATTVYHVQPFLFLIIWSIVFREAIPKEKWVLMLGAFIGVVFVVDVNQIAFDFSSGYILGVLLSLSAAMFWAVSAVMVKKIKTVSPYLIVLIQLAVGVVVLYPFVNFDSVHQITEIQWFYLIVLGAVHSCLTYILIYSAYRGLSTSTIAIMTFIYPAVAIIVDYIFYDESLNAFQIFGVMLIVVSSYISSQNIKIFAAKQ